MKASCILVTAAYTLVLSHIAWSTYGVQYHERSVRQRGMKVKSTKGCSKAPSVLKKGSKKSDSKKQSKSKKKCSSTCYDSTKSIAFVTELTTSSNYDADSTLLLNICPGETMIVPTGTSLLAENTYGIALSNTNTLMGGCTNYNLEINCCGGREDCMIHYMGEKLPTGGYGLFLYSISSDPGATLTVTLNGIMLSSSTPIEGSMAFFELPAYSNTNPNCFNRVSGDFTAISPNVTTPFYFN